MKLLVLKLNVILFKHNKTKIKFSKILSSNFKFYPHFHQDNNQKLNFLNFHFIRTNLTYVIDIDINIIYWFLMPEGFGKRVKEFYFSLSWQGIKVVIIIMIRTYFFEFNLFCIKIFVIKFWLFTIWSFDNPKVL